MQKLSKKGNMLLNHLTMLIMKEFHTLMTIFFNI